jgi:hypothetical protein
VRVAAGASLTGILSFAASAAMRHDRWVQPDEVALGYWLDPILPEDMPMLAARMLAAGHDTPALRRQRLRPR